MFYPKFLTHFLLAGVHTVMTLEIGFTKYVFEKAIMEIQNNL